MIGMNLLTLVDSVLAEATKQSRCQFCYCLIDAGLVRCKRWEYARLTEGQVQGIGAQLLLNCS